MRFAREILEGVRHRIGPDVIVGYRMGAEEFTDGGLSADDNVEIARRFCRDGLVDYLSLAQGNFNSIEQHLPDRHWPILAFRDIHRRFKAASNGIPVIASTRIQSPEQAESVIGAGEADMIGLCRALIVDPDWPQKAERGEADRIRRCIACNQCWAWISTGEPIACATNPVTGREYQWGPLEADKAEIARHVVVVGGGPGGLEAARVAALRGHRVTLLERDDVVGGRIRHASGVRHHEEMRHLLDFLVPEAERASVEIRTGVAADGLAVAALRPDHVIIATGAAAAVPDLPSDGSVPLITSDGSVEIDRGGRNVVIMDEDGYYWTSVIADSVMAQGRTPVIVTRFFEVVREIPVVSRIAFLRDVYRNGGTLMPNTAVTRISQSRVVLANYLTGREEEISDVAVVVWVGFASPSGAHLAQEIEAAGIDRRNIHAIGDAKQPRRLFNALFEGHSIARTIGSGAG
jgi:NADPH-dependent 2,4-dienoyl-CoA reductase/sulfur reductase-like enzyme